MSTLSNKRPIIESGQCRCCGGIKRCRLINVEYEWFGQKEVYTDMLFDCFGLMLTNLDSTEEERLICATCVTRLRDANIFRAQILECEEQLLHRKVEVESDQKIEIDSNVHKQLHELQEDMKQEDIKEEMCIFSDNFLDDVDNISNGHGELENIIVETISPKKKRKKIKTTKKKKEKKLAKGKKTKKEQECTQKGKLLSYGAKLNGGAVPDVKNTKSLQNIFALVENSYVCPFDTSFSDYYCIYCREMYTNPIKLREHTLTHDPKRFSEVYVSTKKLQLDIFRIDCRMCTERIEDLNTLKEHLTSNHGIVTHDVTEDVLKFRLTTGKLTCLECDANFTFFHALKKHMAQHFGTYVCDACGAHYFDERMLTLHQKKHQNVDESYPCAECDKTFKSKYTRLLHVSRAHKKEAAYQCSKCDDVFFSGALRYRHMIKEHGDVRIYQCEQCDRSYDSRKSLREHCRRLHLKIQKHECDMCDKRFYLPSRLKEHMATHTGERNFRCEYCGKSYPRLRGLKVHMQSHVTEKKYKCTVCSASFSQNMNLKSHMKKQHQDMEMIDNNFNE